MPGRSRSTSTGTRFREQVAELAETLDLVVDREVEVGRRLWGSKRRIDLILTEPNGGQRLGIECKFQQTPGTAQEKIPAIIEDIGSWPIDGIVVYDGPGFSANMRTYLDSTGKAIALADLEVWLRLYFGLELGG